MSEMCQGSVQGLQAAGRLALVGWGSGWWQTCGLAA